MSGVGQTLYRKAKILIPGGTQLLSKRPEMFLPEQWPAYYAKASGAYVWDLDGRRLVDMSINGVGTCPLGYADPDVNAAVHRAVEDGSMCTLNCPEEVELAELLCALHPWAEQARYARSGGEVMAIAVRIARACTGREKVVFCGYHGWHDWYLAANLAEPDSLGAKDLLIPGLEPRGVPAPLAGSAFGFRHNQISELEEIATRCAGNLAAIVIEPQRYERPLPEFLEGVRRVADRENAVLIFDEITSAMRLCTGGVHRLYDVEPDLAVLAKGISNGYPMAALIGRRAVMDAAQGTFISSTYWTDRIGSTAALATLTKHQDQRSFEVQIAAGVRVQAIWRKACEDGGLSVEVGHPDMPPLSHMRFLHEEARAVQTLWCQCMLDAGYLDNCTFYATAAHKDAILDEYEKAARSVALQVAEAVQLGAVRERLRGPIGHSGFARLTR